MPSCLFLSHTHMNTRDKYGDRLILFYIFERQFHIILFSMAIIYIPSTYETIARVGIKGLCYEFSIKFQCDKPLSAESLCETRLRKQYMEKMWIGMATVRLIDPRKFYFGLYH